MAKVEQNNTLKLRFFFAIKTQRSSRVIVITIVGFLKKTYYLFSTKVCSIIGSSNNDPLDVMCSTYSVKYGYKGTYIFKVNIVVATFSGQLLDFY